MFKLISTLLFSASLLLLAAGDISDSARPTPLMRTATPDSGKTGQIINVTGDYLGKDIVAAVYLTNGDENFKMTIVSQKDRALVVKIPDVPKPARLRLMVLTTGIAPQFIEQPLMLNVE